MKRRTPSRRDKRRAVVSLRSCSIAALVCAVGSECRAVDRFWGNASGGTFNVGGNWSGGVAAGSLDIAHFGLTTSSPQVYLVNFSASVTNQAIKVEDDFVTFNLTSQAGSFLILRSYSTTAATGNEIGSVAGRTGQLAITSGTFNTAISSEFSIGVNSTSNGRLVIGTGTRFQGAPVMLVGDSGNGSLLVNGFAFTDTTFIANNAGSTGTMTVDGTFSFAQVDDLGIGQGGNGTLIISGGGTMNVIGVPTLGQLSTSNGRVDVTGAGSQWIMSNDLTVGSQGDATMNITSGGLVQGTSALLARSSGGSSAVVTVDGPGSRWINSGTISVGKFGQGTLLITNGGTVQSNGGIVGDGTTSTNATAGRATVDGTGSQWVNTGSLIVGNFAGTEAFTAKLTITNGGVVQSNAATLAMNGHATADLNGTGSQWNNTGNFFVGRTAPGTLEISAGGAMNTTGFISLGSTASGNGVVVVRGANSSLSVGTMIQIVAGSLNVTAGGLVSSTGGFLGQAGSDQSVLVSGAGSRWLNSGSLLIDSNSGAVMNILAGGVVQNTNANISSINEGMVNIGGTGSIWTNDNLGVGGNALSGPGIGTLNVNIGALVTVADRLSICHNGTINLNGGEIDAGTIVFVKNTAFADLSTFNFYAGTVRMTGFLAPSLDDVLMGKLFGSGHRVGPLQNFAVDSTALLNTSLILDGGTFSVKAVNNPSLLSLQRGTFNLTNQNVSIESGGFFGSTLDLPSDLTINVTLGIQNRGLVRGDGQIGGGQFQNLTNGELRVEPGKSLTLTCPAINQGRINLLGGVLEFTQTLTNNTSGVVSGNGTVIAKNGLTNAGSMVFSGHADLMGIVTNNATGKILCTGGGPTTFFNDVANAGEIRTSLASMSVFLGNVTGAGSFSGPGIKVFEAGGAGSVTILSTPGSTIVESSATLSAQFVRENALTVRGDMALRPGNPVSRVTALSIEDDGSLDLTDNSLIIDFDGASPSGAVRDMLADGRLISSLADANHRLGYADNSVLGLSSFGGMSVNSMSVLVKFTFSGDSNLDGQVNAVDLGALASHWLQSSQDWVRGDFNFDGLVDIQDLYRLAINWQGGPGLGAVLNSFGLPSVSVPEPSASLVIALGGLLAQRRRRR